jgi:hypothetical protein
MKFHKLQKMATAHFVSCVMEYTDSTSIERLALATDFLNKTLDNILYLSSNPLFSQTFNRHPTVFG